MTNNTPPSQETETSTPQKEQLDGNLKAALAYVAGWLTGLLFLLTEKEDKFVRFHAAQSLVLFGGINVIAFIPFLGWLVSILLVPIAFILWIVLMIKAYQNEQFELPIIADWAKKVETKI